MSGTPTSGAPVSGAPVSPGFPGTTFGQPPAYLPALPDPSAGPVSGLPAPRAASASIPVPAPPRTDPIASASGVPTPDPAASTQDSPTGRRSRGEDSAIQRPLGADLTRAEESTGRRAATDDSPGRRAAAETTGRRAATADETTRRRAAEETTGRRAATDETGGGRRPALHDAFTSRSATNDSLAHQATDNASGHRPALHDAFTARSTTHQGTDDVSDRRSTVASTPTDDAAGSRTSSEASGRRAADDTATGQPAGRRAAAEVGSGRRAAIEDAPAPRTGPDDLAGRRAAADDLGARLSRAEDSRPAGDAPTGFGSLTDDSLLRPPAPRRSASLEDAEPVRRGRRSAPDPEPEDHAEEHALRPGDVAAGHIAFWDDDAIRHFRAAWHEVKAEFVDDPVTALTRAHDLLTDAVNELSESLLAERDELDPLRGGDTPDTESMRMAMRGYREFLERILAL